jgi:hypothetical protein
VRSRTARRRDTERRSRSGFDPRELDTPYRWFRIVPRRMQAWREVDELTDRTLMREGRWVA